VSKYGLVNEREIWCYGKEAYSIRYAFILRDTGQRKSHELMRSLLVEMFHRGGTENDEEANPERGSLEGNCLIGLFITFFCLI
jgi:hypothetical protein